MSVRLEGVTKRYGPVAAVDGVTLEVADGELFVLLGESGSGKSTILRLIAGLTPLDGGGIFLHGQDVSDLPPQRRGAGMVFQNYSLFQHMTVAQNVEFGLMIRKVAPEERRERRQRLLELVGLAGLDGRYPAQLSGGQQQRVALARALAYEPEVLLLDEPFGALDARIRSYLRGELRRIQRELGVTTIFVTHDREEAFELGDRIGVLLRGRLVADGPPRSLYQEPSTVYLASLLGESNFLRGRLDDGYIRLGEIRLSVAREEYLVEEGRHVLVHFRPEDLHVAVDAEGLPEEALLGRARVQEMVFSGTHVKLRLQPETRIPVPAPEPPAYQEAVGTILATVPSEQEHVLRQGMLWMALKRYRVLPGEALRVLGLSSPDPEGQAVLSLGRVLARAEAIELQVVGSMQAAPSASTPVQGPPEVQIEPLQWDASDRRGLWRELGARLPDMLLLGRSMARELMQDLEPAGDGWLRRARTVIVAVPPVQAHVRRILVATAAGAPGREDVRFAARLARRVRAHVDLLHVFQNEAPCLDLPALSLRGVPQAMHLQQDLRLLRGLGIPAEVMLRTGDAVEQILEVAEEHDAGLLVVGAHLPGRAPWLRRPDVARDIVDRAQRPTAVVYSEVL